MRFALIAAVLLALVALVLPSRAQCPNGQCSAPAVSYAAPAFADAPTVIPSAAPTVIRSTASYEAPIVLYELTPAYTPPKVYSQLYGTCPTGTCPQTAIQPLPRVLYVPRRIPLGWLLSPR